MISYFVRHPVAANLLMLIMVVLGVAVVSNIERETFPPFSPDSVTITVPYPGASALDVDDEICGPLERALTGTTGLASLDCISVEGMAIATAELQEGGAMIQFFNDVSSAISGITDFPENAESERVEIAAQTDLVALIAVSGLMDREALITYTDALADRLVRLQGVAEAKVSGTSDRELRIALDQQSLRRFGLSSSDLVSIIENTSLRQPLGTVGLAAGDLTVRYSGAARTIADLEDLIVIENGAGGQVRLSDVANIALVDSDENSQSFIDGNQAAIITVTKTADEDSIRVFDRLDALLQAEEAANPDPFRITVLNNLSDLISERISLIVQNTVVGLILVFLTMWLFFSLREALWISAALPVSFLGGLYVMSLFGITINMISLIALLMAVGLIMDDSIVIAENIDKWRKKAPPLEAAARGTMEVLPGVFSSFITTACVFGPLMFISGELGQILRFIPMVLLITLALSLVEGFVILPHHLSTPGQAATRARPADRAITQLKTRLIVPTVRTLVHVRYLTVGTVIAVLIICVGLITSGSLKVVGFPEIEGDTIVARIALTSGINRDRTESVVNQLLDGLTQVDEEFTSRTEQGTPLVEQVLVQYAANADTNDNGSHTATVTVELLDSDARNVAATNVLSAWREATGPIPDLVQASFIQSERGPGGVDLDVELLGNDLSQLEAAASALTAQLLARVDVHEANQDFYGGRPELRVTLNAFGQTTGLTAQALSQQLRSAFEGSETDTFRIGTSDRTIRVQVSDTISSTSGVEQFPIVLPAGGQATLSTVADLEYTASYPSVTRKNGLAVARITGQIDRATTTSTAISADILSDFAPQLAQEYPSVTLQIGGATVEQQETQLSIIVSLGLGLVGVYMVLAFQFRSYTLPFVIMVSIPFALIGVILSHWALGLDISMPSLIGFASLAGIVVNNAILFLTFFQNHLEEGDYVSASVQAVSDRFRAILLSSSTTFVGLLPIIFDTSPQVQPLVPLVVSVAFGVLASFILVVLVFPALLSIYFDMVSVRGWHEKFTDGRDPKPRAIADDHRTAQ